MSPASRSPTDPAAEPPATAEKPGDSYVQSFARGLSVIRAFNAERPEQTLTDVASAAGLTRAGARRILLTLQQLGYVEAEGRLFRLTPRVMALGFAYLSSQPVWHLAQPVMEELVRDIHEPSSAAVLDGDDIVCVLRVPARKIMAIGPGPGSRLPAHCTAMGRVLLAGLPESERRARLARTVTDVDALMALLEGVRRDGHALVHGELEEGLVAMAVPIVDRAGRVVAALDVTAQDQRMPPDQMLKRLLPRLLESAAGINALMRMQD